MTCESTYNSLTFWLWPGNRLSYLRLMYLWAFISKQGSSSIGRFSTWRRGTPEGVVDRTKDECGHFLILCRMSFSPDLWSSWPHWGAILMLLFRDGCDQSRNMYTVQCSHRSSARRGTGFWRVPWGHGETANPRSSPLMRTDIQTKKQNKPKIVLGRE